MACCVLSCELRRSALLTYLTVRPDFDSVILSLLTDIVLVHWISCPTPAKIRPYFHIWPWLDLDSQTIGRQI